MTFICLVIAAALTMGGVLAYGVRDVPPPIEGPGSISELMAIDFAAAPERDTMDLGNGRTMSFRAYPSAGAQQKVAVLIHGSSGNSQSMHAVADKLSKAGAAAVYTVDMPGHGMTGIRGDIAYIGQLDDDLAGFLGAVRKRHSGAKFILVGFSSGGGFAVRFAGGPHRALADAYLFLSPYVGYDSPTIRQDFEGWAVPHIPRIVALTFLNQLGITYFNGLTAVSFRIREEDRAAVTPEYSYRLATNFRPRDDYKSDFARIDKPAQLLIGDQDEQFDANAYPRDVGGAAPKMDITVVSGVNHLGMIVRPDALTAITDAVSRFEWKR